jgi:hypothetical protein
MEKPPVMGSDPDDRLPQRGLQASEGDDTPPTGDDARAQRQDPYMALIWGALGLLIAFAFGVLIGLHFGRGPSPLPAYPPAAPRPTASPAPAALPPTKIP